MIKKIFNFIFIAQLLLLNTLIYAIPHSASNLDLEPRESSRDSTIANGSILEIWTHLRSSNPGALAQSKFQVSGRVGYNWAEDTLNTLSTEEKIGQLFIIPVCPLRGDDHFTDIKKMIDIFKVGGLMLKASDPKRQVQLLKSFQHPSQIPMICVLDAEWGLGMRMENVMSFPRNLTLGAVQNMDLLFQLGQEIGRQCKLVGGHINFAPVVDVNCNPENPIIHMRSFGEDPVRVARCALSFMKGMQAAGIAACAKHFPGHGDTSVDSHQDLPSILHKWERLEKIELYPFKELIAQGVDAIMTGHLFLPALETEEGLPATLSEKIVSGLLKKQLGFQGIVFSDALNMKALTRYASPGEIAVKAFNAGNDFLLYGDHIAPNVDQILREEVPQAFTAIKSAVERGSISLQELDQRVLNILKLKEKLHLTTKPFLLDEENLEESLHLPHALTLRKELYRQAATLVENNRILPLDPRKKYALFNLTGYAPFTLPLDTFSSGEELQLNAHRYAGVIIPIYPSASMQDRFHLPPIPTISLPAIFIVFGTPYSLIFLPPGAATLVCYEDVPDAHETASELLFGRIKPSGRLPVTAKFPAGTGLYY